MELKLYIRQNPILNILNQQIYYSGTAPTNIEVIIGTLPTPRQWPNYNNFIDVTTNCSDLFDLKLQWTEQKDNNGNTLPGSNQIKKGIAGTVTVEGEAYQLIKQWLIEDISAPFNQVECKIEDTSCGFYEGYIIKSQDIQYCESGLCEFQLTLKQKDDAIACIKKTVIYDNWQGWFQKEPLNGKKHPRFSYCIEARPNGSLIGQYYIFASTFATNIIIIFITLLMINPILAILNAIQNILGANWNIPQPINLGDIFAGAASSMFETAGCGREHPAPLIRDYITNVCDRCGVIVDEVTAPIFFAPSITIQTSDPGRGQNGVITSDNPHYNATYFYAPAKRGIRRFRKLTPIGLADPNTTEFWIPENAPLLTLDMFLDQLKPLYNAEWRVKGGKLYFWRKDWFLDGSYIYDFSKNGMDRAKILEGICFEQNEVKLPASCVGLYQTDAADSNEAGGANGDGQMNGVVSFVNNAPTTLASAIIDTNPAFDGILDKTTGFGATKFRLDGASTDYIYDAVQVVLNGLIFTVLTGIPGTAGALFSLMQALMSTVRQYGDYALLMQTEIAALPKILIWNGENYLNAKSVKPKAAWDGVAPQPMPDINPIYNVTPQLWKERHYPETDVIGKNLTFPASPNGIYKVTDYFGITFSENPAILVNYPMYFEPFYYDTMWDWFHWIDDPRHNPKINQKWRVTIPLCCEDLEKIKCLGDGNSIVLGEKVKGTNLMYPDMKIEDILVSYKTGETYGKTITLSGTL